MKRKADLGFECSYNNQSNGFKGHFKKYSTCNQFAKENAFTGGCLPGFIKYTEGFKKQQKR